VRSHPMLFVTLMLKLLAIQARTIHDFVLCDSRGCG
jgi:hypothetical protein